MCHFYNISEILYDHLNYLPSDVKDGTNPLNECNAYDINGDGPISGYIYYSTKDAPYSIGCFMGETGDYSALPNPVKNHGLSTELRVLVCWNRAPGVYRALS